MDTLDIAFELNTDDLYKKTKKPKQVKNDNKMMQKNIGETIPFYYSQVVQGMAENRLYKNVINPEEYATSTLEVRLAKYGGLVELLQQNTPPAMGPVAEPVAEQQQRDLQEIQEYIRKIRRFNIERNIDLGLGNNFDVNLTKDEIYNMRLAFAQTINPNYTIKDFVNEMRNNNVRADYQIFVIEFVKKRICIL